MITGCRIPYEYFVTTGAGESDQGPGENPFETGSYDIALEKAGIENFNIVTYSSVMPAEAKEIPFEEARKRFHHGAVLETIMASINGVKGEHICAGVGRIWLEVPDEPKGIGFAAEYEGHASQEKASLLLQEDLMGIVQRRFKNYRVIDEEYSTEDLVVDDEYGTVLAAICFISHIYPELENLS